MAAMSKLTTEERALLMEHQGCLKCRVFYAGHFAGKCTAERPTPEQCKKVTKDVALKAKAAFEKSQKGSSSVVVAAVFGSDDSSEPSSGEDEDGYGANEYVPSFDSVSDSPPISPSSTADTLTGGLSKHQTTNQQK
jgi:hypothetical protein